MNTEHDWSVWWHDEGSGMRPLKGQDHESHVRHMTRIAWLNGAFGASDEIERLRAERDEARREVCLIIAGKCGKSTFVSADAIAEAQRRGWDCFPEAKP